MKERDPATFTDLKQFMMLSSDPHLCFSIHKRCFCSIKHFVNALEIWAFQPAECTELLLLHLFGGHSITEHCCHAHPLALFLF